MENVGYDKEKTDLPRQDEDISAPEFGEEEAQWRNFGNWPEALGIGIAALLIFLSFAFVG